MSYEWFVSLRYLRAKRKQTFISVISFISIAGVTLGVAALIVVLAVMTGFHDGVRQQILGNVPHVLVQKHGEPLDNYEEVVEIALTVSHVEDAVPFVSEEAMLLSRGNVSAVNIKGIQPENKIFQQDFLSMGNGDVRSLLFEDDDSLPGIVIGLDTATGLGVAVGDRINVIPPKFTVTPFGMIPKMKPFRIVGITQGTGGFLETYLAYIAFDEAQKFFGSPDRASGVEVEADSFDNAALVADLLREKLEFPFSVRSWENLFGSFLSALKLEKLGLFIVLAIIVLVAAFNIATTLIMIVMEKHKDIGILRAMGATSKSIMKIFVLEGFIVGSVGTALGTGLGLLLALNADPIIKGLEKLLGIRIFDQAVYGMEKFPSQVVPGDVLAVVAVAMTISLLATIYPAWRAASMDPGESLRYE